MIAPSLTTWAVNQSSHRAYDARRVSLTVCKARMSSCANLQTKLSAQAVWKVSLDSHASWGSEAVVVSNSRGEAAPAHNSGSDAVIA